MKPWLIFAGTLLLAGCGGGGGGGGVATAPPADTPSATQEEFTAATGTFAGTVNFDAGLAEALTHGYSSDPNRNFGDQVNAQGYRRMPDGSLLIFTALYEQYDPTTPDGLRSTVRYSVAPGGGSQQVDYFFSIAPLRILRIRSSDDETTVTSTGALPTAGRVGDSGPFYTYRTVSAAGQPLATGTVTWSIAADTDTTVFACLTTVERETGSTADFTSIECYQAVPSGHFVGKMRVKVTGDGSTIVFNKDN